MCEIDIADFSLELCGDVMELYYRNVLMYRFSNGCARLWYDWDFVEIYLDWPN